MDGNKALPPKSIYTDIIKISYSSHHQHHKFHILSLPEDISDQIESVLKEMDITMESFFQKACVDLLESRQLKKKEMQDYLDFNEMRITENPWNAWSYEDSSSASEVNLKESKLIKKMITNAGSGSEEASEEHNTQFIKKLVTEHKESSDSESTVVSKNFKQWYYNPETK
jgi:hypothetical protein